MELSHPTPVNPPPSPQSASVPADGLLETAAGATPDHWTTCRQGKWTWTIRETWQSFITAKGAPNWLSLEQDSRAVLVKSNDNRQVWRVAIGERFVYVKVMRPLSHWNRWRSLLRGSDAARELRTARYAQAHDIRTVQPVAAGEGPVCGNDRIASIFISAGLANAVPLNTFWRELETSASSERRMRNAVIDDVALLIAHAHQNGFTHADLHAGNILLVPTGDGSYRSSFVDLQSVRINRTVNDADVVRNLAQFNQWFRLNGRLTDRMRFLNRYLHWRSAVVEGGPHRRDLRLNARGMVQALRLASHQHALALNAKRDRRALRSGKYFARIRLGGGWRGHVLLKTNHPAPGSRLGRLTLAMSDWKKWMLDPLKWVTTTDRRKILKDSPSSVVCRESITMPDGQPLQVICKRALARNLVRRLQSLIRPSRPMLTWCRAHALLHRQIPTATPLAVLERRRFGLLLDSVILTEYVENAHDLDTLLTIQLRDLPPRVQRRLKLRLINALVRVIHQLHEAGYVHRDMKAPNILVQWQPETAEEARVLLVDLDGIHHRPRSVASGAVREITRLNVSLDHCHRLSRADRLRFLLRFLNHPDFADWQWKDLWRKIELMSHNKRGAKARDLARKLQKPGRF